MQAALTSPAVSRSARNSQVSGCPAEQMGWMDLVRSESSTNVSHRKANPATVPDTLASGGSRAVPTGLPLGRTSAEREEQITAGEYCGV